MLAHIPDISGAKRKQNLTAHAEDARISKQLATVDRGVPLDVDPTAEATREPDRSRLREVFREYELRDPLRRLEEALGEAELAVPVGATEVRLTGRVRAGTVEDIASLEGGAAGRWSKRGCEPKASVSRLRSVSRAPLVSSIDEELCIAVRQAEVPEGALFGQDGSWHFAVASGEDVLCGECESPEAVALACRELPVVVHDAKALGLVPPGLAHDTLLGAYLLEPARRGYPFAELCEERGLAAEVEDAAAGEALLVGALAAWQREQIAERGLEGLMRDIELPLVGVLRAVELIGVRLNVPRLQEVAARVRDEIAELEQEIFALADEEFLIASPQQLGEILFEKLGLSRKRRGKIGYSTDARVLQAIRSEHVIVPKIERWRELSTLIKTYFDVLPAQTDERSRIHTTFLQAVAQTGRLSSTNPNMQNVPIRTALGREIRGCFEAEDGRVLISADYSQIELRVLANAAEEPVLKEIFARGEDVHTATASQVFQVAPELIDPGMRAKSKMINYGIVYGLSDYGLADRLNIPREEAKAFIDAYLARLPRVALFMQETIERAKEEGHVTTLWGRRRQIPELRARNYQVRSLGERLAVNTVVQGTAADIIKLAMVRCHRALEMSGLDACLILTIHDELLFEASPDDVPVARELIAREMVGVWDLQPPMAVEIGVGRNWLEAK